jgi:hypothetical protein
LLQKDANEALHPEWWRTGQTSGVHALSAVGTTFKQGDPCPKCGGKLSKSFAGGGVPVVWRFACKASPKDLATAIDAPIVPEIDTPLHIPRRDSSAPIGRSEWQFA